MLTLKKAMRLLKTDAKHDVYGPYSQEDTEFLREGELEWQHLELRSSQLVTLEDTLFLQSLRFRYYPIWHWLSGGEHEHPEDTIHFGVVIHKEDSQQYWFLLASPITNYSPDTIFHELRVVTNPEELVLKLFTAWDGRSSEPEKFVLVEGIPNFLA